MKTVLKKSLIISILLSIVLSFISFAEVSKSEIEQNAINILNGYYAPYYFSKDHQLYLKANAIKNLNKSIHTVIVGSSHLQSLATKDVGADCINLSIGGGTFQDKLNTLGLLDYYKVKYDRIIMDFTMVELCAYTNADVKASPLNSFGKYFIEVIKNKKKSKPITDFNTHYKNTEAFDLNKKYTEEELDKMSFYYRKDFSTLYSDLVYINRETNLVKLNEIIDSESNISKFKISGEAKQIVIDMIKYFNSKSIKVNLMMIPKPPAIFNKLEMYKYKVVREMTELFINLVVNYGCRVEGAYDPNFIGATMEDFYDCYHMYPESFEKFYKFD